MARNARTKRFTVYDVMEARGDFEENTANSISPDYRGPVAYPKMLYHPLGQEEITVPAEEIRNSQGDVIGRVGEQKQIIHRIVGSREEERMLLADGWHDHPAKAIAASGRIPPPISAEHRITEMERRIQELEEELANARKNEEQTQSIAAQAISTDRITPVRSPIRVKAPVLHSAPAVTLDEDSASTSM